MSRRCHATALAIQPQLSLAELYQPDDRPAQVAPIDTVRVMCELREHTPATNHLATLESSVGPIPFEFPWRY